MNFICSLLKLRKVVNNIDKEILELLFNRQLIAKKIAIIKAFYGKSIRDRTREKKILKELVKNGSEKDLDKDFILKLFNLIIQESVSLQEKEFSIKRTRKKNEEKTVAFLGPEGSYSSIAAKIYFKEKKNQFIEKPCCSFKKVISLVEKNKAKYGIVPIENSFSGYISQVCSILLTTNLYVLEEITIPINHCLLAGRNTSIERIKVLYSHPEPVKQCSKFLSYFPHWKIKFTKSSTEIMERISRNKNDDEAVIGNEIARKIYKLIQIKPFISNKKNNSTRFFILSTKFYKIKRFQKFKITILLGINKEKNSIEQIKSLLSKKIFNLKKIQIKNDCFSKLQNVYFLDIEEKRSAKSIKLVLKKLVKITNFFKIIGMYPSFEEFR